MSFAATAGPFALRALQGALSNVSNATLLVNATNSTLSNTTVTTGLEQFIERALAEFAGTEMFAVWTAVLGAVVIFYLLYFPQTMAMFLELVFMCVLPKNTSLSMASCKIALLGGALYVKDVQWVTENYMVRCHTVVIKFVWWTQEWRTSRKDDQRL